jgi:hypothetical protein
LPPQTVSASWSPDGQHLDLFSTNTTGSAVSTWWEKGCGWQPWFLIQPDSGKFQSGQPIAALWSGLAHLDLFAVDVDGRVVSTWWEGEVNWQTWFAIHPDQIKAAPGQAVTALWNGSKHLDLFVTDQSGRVASTWWEPGRSWQHWFFVSPESAHGAPGQAVTAVWNGQHLDLFMTDDHGRVVSTWWELGKGWQPWFAIHPESGASAPGQSVTALWASGGTHLDLFIANQQGHVLSTWWEAARGWQGWFDIHSGHGIVAPRQTVTAKWSSATHLDLFVADRQGQVFSTWWESAGGWKSWFQIQAASLQVKSPQTVTALWNGVGHLDLFATSADGSVASTWWEGARAWQPWFHIFPSGLQAHIDDAQNVLTQGHDPHRTGAFTSEKSLNPETVSSFRFAKLYSRQVEGQMFAQPLYARNVPVVGRTRGYRNLLVLATTANRVYAFDADNLSMPQDGNALVFQRQLHPSSALEQSARNTDVEICGQTSPSFFGITATPVIDPATDTLYVVAYDTSAAIENTNPQQFGQYVLHALDLRDGLKDRVPPVRISAPGFSPHKGRNRAGLLFMNGMVYLAFSSFICDHPLDASGWVFAYRKEDLSQAGAFRPDPALMGGGIWQSGRGLVGDAGHVYYMTGNESARAPKPDSLANSFVKLNTSCHGEGLALGGKFTPANTVELSLGDTDLASSGPLLLRGNRLIGGGKQGRVYVMDSQTMKLSQNQTSVDGFQGFQAFRNTWHDDHQQPECAANADAICRKKLPSIYPFLEGGLERQEVDCKNPQSDPLKIERCAVINGWNHHLATGSNPGCFLPISCYQFDQGMGPNIHAGFALWDGFPTASKARLYALAEKDFLKSFEYDMTTGLVAETPVAVNEQIRSPDGMPGGAVSISSDGGTNGVLWVSKHDEDAMEDVHPGHLYAVDASNLKILWQEANISFFAKFNAPMIADGKVFLATWGKPRNRDTQVTSAVLVFGLRSPSISARKVHEK